MDIALTTTRRLIRELFSNMEQRTYSIVYDPLGDRAGLLFNAARGDRVLELRSWLNAGDIMILMAVPDRSVRLYAGEVTRRPALRRFEQLLASQEQATQALVA